VGVISSTDSSGTTFFHYDGASPNVIAETDGEGGTIATYAYDAAGRLHSMRRGGETYYYHANGHGDVIALTDASGDVVNSYRYDPWGKVLSASETRVNPYRYAGYRYDAATGLCQLWNRYYSPMTMRFITKDLYPGQTTSPGTMNGYAYCLGNPVNAVDPSGLFWTGVSAGLTVATAVVGGLAIFATVVSGGTLAPLAFAMTVSYYAAAQMANDMAYQENEIGPTEHYSNRAINALSLVPGTSSYTTATSAGLVSLGCSMQTTRDERIRQREFLGQHDQMFAPDLFTRPSY